MFKQVNGKRVASNPQPLTNRTPLFDSKTEEQLVESVYSVSGSPQSERAGAAFLRCCGARLKTS
jgi:hypothetical protein